jgi:hypothetical protein
VIWSRRCSDISAEGERKEPAYSDSLTEQGAVQSTEHAIRPIEFPAFSDLENRLSVTGGR